ncbi:HNH endonuclease signature motif containing protein [Geodermatophilus amargosae]|uniref:HNH endonuclease signature motif containing protein n=1 Tax=Geodermatophilus amargosae TaxID=1296565 RepID=UPI0034E01A57
MCSGELVGGDVLDGVAVLVAERNWIDARLVRRVRAAELSQAPERDGQRSMASWLRGHCRLSGSEASRLVRNGRAIEHLPALGEAHDAGLVSAEQVAVAARAVTPQRLAAAVAQGIDLGVIDAVVTRVAVEQDHAALVRVVQRYLDDLDPDGSEPDPTEGRSLTLAKHADGALSIRGQLDAVGGEKLQAALESLVQADRPAGDERSRAQRFGDALAQLADNALVAGNLPVLRGHKPQVAVVIRLEDLADPATGPGAGRMGFGAVISAAKARWLACDGAVSRVVFGPDGAPLDLGREQRLASRHIRRATELRDGGCVFTGCSAPTHWCDVHHLVHWIDGGETSLDNFAHP